MNDTSPKDQAKLLWNAPKAPFRQPKPGEPLFSFLRGHDRFLCELRDHGEFGVEAMFWHQEEFLYSRRFDTRKLAVQWATIEPDAIEKGGA